MLAAIAVHAATLLRGAGLNKPTDLLRIGDDALERVARASLEALEGAPKATRDVVEEIALPCLHALCLHRGHGESRPLPDGSRSIQVS